MALEALLDSKNIIETRKLVSLDYSTLDPDHVEKIDRQNQELSAIFKKANAEAQKIINDAQSRAYEMDSAAHEEAAAVRESAEAHAVQLKEQAEAEYQRIVNSEQDILVREKEALKKEQEDAQQRLELYRKQIKEEVTKEMWQEIRKGVEEKVTQEYTRLLDQVHEILNAAIQQRREVLNETEKDISELVILIARKVVKVLSQSDSNIVIQNMVQALGKLKGREKFLIRVNAAHLEELKSFIPKIKEQLEIDGVISLVEDTRVDVGGCIIESEFGEIDARISTQLAEIEKRIRDTELVKNVSF